MSIINEPKKTSTLTRYMVSFSMLALLFTSAACSKKEIAYFPRDIEVPQEIEDTLEGNSLKDALEMFYADWQGTPYQFGSMSHKRIDCSGLTLLAYRDIFDFDLPRTAAEQATQGESISPDSLQPGDLVFFKTGFYQKHVGIYLEDSKFIHASSSKGVMISSLDEPYWQKQYWKANRVKSL
jgi:lipoprotein Spr/probable lipoprotein NlpC